MRKNLAMPLLSTTGVALVLCFVVPAAAEVSFSGFVDVGYWAARNPNHGLTNATSGLPDRLQASASTLGSHDGDNQFSMNDLELGMTTQLSERTQAALVFNFGNGASPTVAEAFVAVSGLSPLELDLTLGRFCSVFGIENAYTCPLVNRFITTSLLSPFTTGSLDGVAISGTFGAVTGAFAVSNDDLLPGNTLGINPLPAAGGGVSGLLNDNNNDRSVMGRIGWSPIEAWTLGVSAARTVWAAPTASGTAPPDVVNPARVLLGCDAAYDRAPWHIKGEYVTATEEQSRKLGAEVPIRWTGWYVEAWYDWDERVGFGGRYSRIQARQSTVTVAPPANVGLVSDYSTLAVAIRWAVAETVFVKAEYDLNEEPVLARQGTAGSEADNDVFALSLVAGF